MNNQPTTEEYGADDTPVFKTPKFLSKEAKPMTTILLVSVMFVIVAAMCIFILIEANKEVQLDYNQQCADLCYEDGQYRYADETCTCIDREGMTTNYFIMDGEFVQVGVGQDVN